jgi:ABC-type bacteriocin/lantibiotic exporter with double-glycine peptidase domain
MDRSIAEKTDADAGLRARFPALKRLGLRGRKRVPVVRQLAATECGAACLTMAMGYFGKNVRLEEVRDVCGVDRDGASALGILNAAQFYGLRGRGLKLDIDDLEFLPVASILHWEFNHFVVFERLIDGAVDIVDPAFGPRRVPMDVLRRSFTGVALQFEPGDDFERKSDRSHGVWRHAKRVILASDDLLRVLVTSILIQIFALAVPIFTGALVDRVVPRSDSHLLIILTIGLSTMVAFRFLAALVRGHLLLHLRTQLDLRMTLGFLDHLVALPCMFFQRRSAGDLMMRLNSNATIRELLTASVLSGFLDGAMVSFYLVILLAANLRFGALVTAMGFAEVAIFLLIRQRQRELMSRSLQVQARCGAYEVEMFAGLETLKAMGAEQRAVEHFSDLFVDVLNVSLSRGALSVIVDATTTTLRVGSPIAVLVYGAWSVLSGDMTLGTMLALSALAQGFLGPLSTLIGAAGQLQLLGSYVERIDDVLSAAPEQDSGKVRLAPRLRGRVTVEDVTFRYGAHAPFVLENISVDIPSGSFVAIVGRSGSGKSTLASLLLGLHRPTTGRVLFDGADLTEVDVRSLRRQVGIVMQRAHIFGSSIRQNIALSDPSLSLDAVKEAAQLTKIHDEIMATPMGYETLLLEGGISISGGQRQRLAIARALVAKPAILLLDEATSALDSVTESAVQQSLARLGCTRIVIAHRLSTVVKADLILVVDKGKIIERGTHAALMQRKGVYAQLVDAQMH